ncbi:MAG: hypothetical protein ABI399_08595 [Bauldia sp.]
MIGRWSIHGHAIVSADDRIADASGVTPPSLRNDHDWRRFQAALDRAAVTVLGRLGHEANPNFKRRIRLVLSTSSKGIERRADAWWWNPAHAPLGDALASAAPAGGVVAVPGGRRVFDLFLTLGFDEFHLARAGQIVLSDGIPVFSAIRSDHDANSVLAASGLTPGAREWLDPAAGVSLTIWRA